MSNTKLNSEQKSMRKTLRKSFGPQCVMLAVGRVTMFLQPEFAGSNMGLLSISIASPNETKIRRKVGEYMALERAANGKYVKVPMAASLEDIGNVLNGETIGDVDKAYSAGYGDGELSSNQVHYDEGYSAGFDDGMAEADADNSLD
jgi:hypothetical protein